MASRHLLTDEERWLLLGVPHDPDALARHYTFTRFDQELVVGRRGAANRLGFAVQLALLRHPGTGLVQMGEPVDALVTWLAARLDIPAATFTEYASRPQTMTDHARILAAALGLRPPSAADLPFMIEAAAQSAWSTDRVNRLLPGLSLPSVPRRSFFRHRRLSSELPLPAVPALASAPRMPCSRASPLCRSPNSTDCSPSIRRSARHHSLG